MLFGKPDAISKPPDIDGMAKVWAVDIDAMRKRHAIPPDAGIAMWVVEAPWANLAWHSYLITLIHLRQVEGLGAPKINLEGATHEVFVYALNPDGQREPFIKGDALIGDHGVTILTPANYVGQFIEPSDAAALERVERAVREIAAGHLSPDTDFRFQWIERFGDSNVLHK